MALSWFKDHPQTTEPFLFFSYGMTKCGSTLAFQLARVALIEAGFEQPVIRFPGVPEGQRINFIGKFTQGHLDQLDHELAARGYPLAIKTHTRPSPVEVKLMETGVSRAHAVFRDPRDMALSMRDAGAKARASGRPAFSEIVTLADACRGIDNQMDSLSAWLQLPGVRRLQYDSIAFDTQAVAQSILDHLGIEGHPKKVARRATRREFTQLNKALPQRHLTEMTEAQSRYFQQRYAPFFDLVLDRPDPGKPLPPGTCLYQEMDSPPPLG